MLFSDTSESAEQSAGPAVSLYLHGARAKLADCRRAVHVVRSAFPLLSLRSPRLCLRFMPQHKSSAKRVRQDARRRARNRYHKTRVRTMMKALDAETSRTDAEAKLNEIKAYLDRMATKRLLHPNTAAHTKSRLERFVGTLA